MDEYMALYEQARKVKMGGFPSCESAAGMCEALPWNG